MVDVIGAVRAYLDADSDVNTEVGARVYVGNVPRSESTSQPRKTVLLRYAGGQPHTRTAAIVQPRIEIWCIAATFYQADEVYRDVYDAMRAIQKTTQDSVLLLTVRLPDGPLQLKDADTGWPAQIGIFTVMAGLD